MLRKATALGVLLMVVAIMAACGSEGESGGETASAKSVVSGEATGVTLNADYADALPVPSQLAIGTLMLEDTDDAVTTEQASELLPFWKMLQALQSSGTAAQVELDAVLNQIQGTMADGQLLAIKGMKLTSASMMELAQERGLGFGRGFGGGEGGTGGFQPPAGFVPGGEGPGGGMGGGMGPGGAFVGGQNLNPDEQEAALAERANTFLGAAMSNTVISMLEARAEGQTWEVAAPNQDLLLQRTLFAAIAEVLNIDQQEIVAQAREGKSLLELVEASGVDVDTVLAKVVAMETERIGQAVADESMTQDEADTWLAGLEERAKTMLGETFQFGGRGAPGEDAAQP